MDSIWNQQWRESWEIARCMSQSAHQPVMKIYDEQRRFTVRLPLGRDLCDFLGDGIDCF